MPTANIPRFLLPSRTSLKPCFHLHTIHLRPSQPTTALSTPRHTSTKPPPSNPRVLEKPSKFTPPSHPARLNRPAPRQYPGPPLTGPAKEAQKTRQYPRMMPPEGSFMRWFLTSRGVHIYITLTTLTVLALYTTLSNFHSTSPFAHLLPAHDTFPSHPFEFIKQYIEVYKLHTAHISAETAERRRKKVEDVRKRGEYRRAHGLEGGQGLGGWRAKEDGEELGPALAVEGAGVRVEDGEGVYKDWEGRKKPVRKWLGIW